MAIAKAELEAHRHQYHALLAEAQHAVQAGDYVSAVARAQASLEFIDGMMQYERKYENKEFVGVETIDLILTYGPVLFSLDALSALETLLKTQRRIERNTSADLSAGLADAKELLWDARSIWNYLETPPDSRPNAPEGLSNNGKRRWLSAIKTWEAIGLLKRQAANDTVIFSTDIDAPTVAKCSLCGSTVNAPKLAFLQELTCPKCNKRVAFVIISNESVVRK